MQSNVISAVENIATNSFAIVSTTNSTNSGESYKSEANFGQDVTNIPAATGVYVGGSLTPTNVPWLTDQDLTSLSAVVGGTALQVLAGVLVALAVAVIELSEKTRTHSRTVAVIKQLVVTLVIGGVLWFGIIGLMLLAPVSHEKLRFTISICVGLQVVDGIVACILLWLTVKELLRYKH